MMLTPSAATTFIQWLRPWQMQILTLTIPLSN